MGKISLYSTLTNPLGDDILIGTDVHDSSITKNFSIQSLFDIGLEISTSKIHLYDSTIENYGEITLDNDVFRVKGAPLNTRNLLVSSATGYLSFKKNNFDAVFNASSISDNQTWTLPDYSGTIALVETNDLQQVTDAGNVSTNGIKIPELFLFDNSLEEYGRISLDNDVFTVRGSLPSTHNLFVSDDSGFISFKKGNNTIKLDATATTDDRTYIMPDESGTLALQKYKVFTALLTQSGGDTEDSINSGSLTVGVTYRINEVSPGMDFRNVGAASNDLGTYFMASGTTPASWGSGATYTLAYSAGCPTAYVLENTIGNVWFTYDGVGNYLFNSNGLFTDGKNVNTLDQTTNISISSDGIYNAYMFTESVNTQRIIILDGSISNSDNLLSNKLIEIRVYN